MKKRSIIDLIDDENLENALTLREKYIENASLPKQMGVRRVMKRVCAACLALFFLLIPASAFLIQELPPHVYRPPDHIEIKASFKEMNDILGTEHLYNRLPEEYTVLYKITYRDQLWGINTSMNMNFANNLVIGDLMEMQKVPSDAEIFQIYPNGDRLRLDLRLNVDECRFYTGDAYTEIGSVTVHLDFAEHTQYARFFYQEHTYVLSLESESTNITHYLQILLDEENRDLNITHCPKKSFVEVKQ